MSLEATYGQSLTLTANAFEKDDKEFAGWSLTSNGPVRYPDNAQVQDLTTQSGGSVTLYAVWRTPLSEVQKPYLAELEQAFQSYSSGRSASTPPRTGTPCPPPMTRVRRTSAPPRPRTPWLPPG